MHFPALLFPAFLLRAVEQGIEIGFCHEVAGLLLGFVGVLERGLLPGLVEVDLLEGVHEIGDGQVLFVGFVEGRSCRMRAVPHNDIIVLI